MRGLKIVERLRIGAVYSVKFRTLDWRHEGTVYAWDDKTSVVWRRKRVPRYAEELAAVLASVASELWAYDETIGQCDVTIRGLRAPATSTLD